jgi:hypothetical protein
MKINWKALIALAVLLTVIIWAVTSLRSLSYSGTKLNFAIGGGAVTVTNASDQPATVQLVGSGTRAFVVSSTTERLLTGSSTKVGTGNTATQIFDFTLPPGSSTFSVERGSNVALITGEEPRLEATVQQLTPDNARTTLIFTGILAVVILFYISNTTEHQWVRRFLPQKEAPAPVTAQNIFTLSDTKRPAASGTAPTNFKEWLIGQSDRKDPVGELARTAASDPAFPNQAIDVRLQLRRYNATDATLEACAQAIREYNLTA